MKKIYFDMSKAVQNYYLFIGVHSFLLGLFPFFLPVYLFKSGVTLQEIAWFIAVTGLTFSGSLFLFDYLRSSSYLVPLILSFFFELVLLIAIVLGAPLFIVAILNGTYSCLYWMLQRILFLAGGTTKDSGKRFGNFQIYILAVLQGGIFAGGVLLEHAGIWVILLLSLLLIVVFTTLFFYRREQLYFPNTLIGQAPVRLKNLLTFKDKYNSKLIFIFDGMYLYLESYLWVMSLFLMVGESFIKLGGLVIFLAIVLGAIFFVIKNRIDRMNTNVVYGLGVGLYALSWLLRGLFDPSFVHTSQMMLLLVIAFCTSFFRLTFNKRFFDLAEKNGENHYLILKSHYSQLFLALGFVFIGMSLFFFSGSVSFLSNIYFGAALFAPIYLFYRYDERKGADHST